MMDEKEILEKANRRVKDKKEFFIHLITFCLIMPFLILINMLTVPSFWWFLFALGGWIIGLAGHYISVFGIFGSKTGDWEKRQLEKEVAQLEEENNLNDDDLELPDDHLELKERIKVKRDWSEDDLV